MQRQFTLHRSNSVGIAYRSYRALKALASVCPLSGGNPLVNWRTTFRFAFNLAGVHNLGVAAAASPFCVGSLFNMIYSGDMAL